MSDIEDEVRWNQAEVTADKLAEALADRDENAAWEAIADIEGHLADVGGFPDA